MQTRASHIPTDLLGAIETILNAKEDITEFDFQGDRIRPHKVIYGLAPIGAKLPKTPQVPIPYPTTKADLAYIQYAMASLTDDGEAAIIVPHGFLFREGLDKTVRNELFTYLNVHTILSLPNGFLPMAGIKCDVLFFNRDTPNGTWVWRQDKQSRSRQHDLSDFLDFMQIPYNSRGIKDYPLAVYIPRYSLMKYIATIEKDLKLIFDIFH